MAPTTIGRSVDTDDDGTGLTGTVRNNNWLQTEIYDAIDNLFKSTIRLTGRLAPEGTQAITLAAGNTNNQAINATASLLLLAGNNPSGSTLTGIVAPTSLGGDMLFIRRTSGAGAGVTIANESASSTAANRFNNQSGADVLLTANTVGGATGFYLYVYDWIIQRWVSVKLT